MILKFPSWISVCTNINPICACYERNILSLLILLVCRVGKGCIKWYYLLFPAVMLCEPQLPYCIGQTRVSIYMKSDIMRYKFLADIGPISWGLPGIRCGPWRKADETWRPRRCKTNGGETDVSLLIIRHTTECASVFIFHHRFERGGQQRPK